jgi:hypothetical protein
MKNGFLKNIRATESSSSMQPKKSSRKTLLAVLLIVVVVVVIVGVYLATMNNAGTDTSATPTPAPTATSGPTGSSSPTATPAPTSTGVDVADASSLQYSVDATSGGVSQGSYTYYGKNAGTANFMMRIDYTDDTGAQGAFIINSAEQKAWSYSDGTWTDISEAYTMQYDTWNTLWQGYVGSLSAWNGIGDYTYSANGDSVRIYGVMVNPSLPDSLFTPS